MAMWKRDTGFDPATVMEWQSVSGTGWDGSRRGTCKLSIVICSLPSSFQVVETAPGGTFGIRIVGVGSFYRRTVAVLFW